MRCSDSVEREALKQATEGCISGVRHWPRGALRAIKEILAGADSISSTDAEAREKALRTLCIRAEIHTESPTPASDQESRRKYQVQRLMQAMGQGMGADDGSRETMALEWISIGAVAPELHMELQERFLRCWQTNRRTSEQRRALS
jgi:hypothetical protein